MFSVLIGLVLFPSIKYAPFFLYDQQKWSIFVSTLAGGEGTVAIVVRLTRRSQANIVCKCGRP